MSRITRFLLIAGLCCLLPATAWAWARLGHALVGEIAQRHLTPATRAEVATLLAGEPTPTLAGVASWADDLRDTDPARFRATSRWHFVNARDNSCHLVLARDCPDGNCVVGALQRQLAILGDRNQPLDARREALKFVVHLVGDEHQPLHNNNRPDAGGNRYQISLRTPIQPEAYAQKNYANGIMGTNLHSVWDYYILASRRMPLAGYATLLDKQPPANLPPLADGALQAWSEESCELIDAHALYPANDQHSMGHDYLDKMRPLAESQVELAGLRLAQLLNQTLGK